MNILKFPTPEKMLSEQERIEIARQEILAEVRLMEAQGLLDFVEIEQQPGEVIQFPNSTHTDEFAWISSDIFNYLADSDDKSSWHENVNILFSDESMDDMNYQSKWSQYVWFIGTIRFKNVQPYRQKPL